MLTSVYAAVLYNALLALANAAGWSQSYGSIVAVELAILGALAFFFAASDTMDLLTTAIVGFGILTSIYVTLASQSLALDCARDCAIIGLFSLLGSQITHQQLHITFRVLSALVLIGLILELCDTDLFAKLFQPSSYYVNTRGIEEFSLDSSGLFRNALGFEGRFSFGLSTHRTTSLFIEQVSLANFAGVLGVYLLAQFDRLATLDKALHLLTAILIVLTNDSRTSTTLLVVFLFGYFLFPKVRASYVLLVMPMVLAFGSAVYMATGGNTGEQGDNLRGRVAVTIANLSQLDLSALLGFEGFRSPSLMDSGYPFVITVSTIFGLLGLWLLLAAAVPDSDPRHRRCLFSLNLYMSTNLLIGGTAVFSIKVAAPLWLLVGFMRETSKPALPVAHARKGARAVRPVRPLLAHAILPDQSL